MKRERVSIAVALAQGNNAVLNLLTGTEDRLVVGVDRGECCDGAIPNVGVLGSDFGLSQPPVDVSSPHLQRKRAPITLGDLT